MNNPNPTDYMSHTLPKKPSSSANQFQLPTARYRQSRKKERATDKTPQTSSRNGKNKNLKLIFLHSHHYVGNCFDQHFAKISHFVIYHQLVDTFHVASECKTAVYFN
jgi:hypothetical protein